MPTEYTLSDLVKLTGVSPRTVRYYIAQGLLPSPTQQGPGSRYTEAHVDRLRLIRKLQSAHLPLAEIRRQIGALPDDQLATMADRLPASEPSPGSALDYIQDVLHGDRNETTTFASAAFPMPAAAAPATAAAEPDRAQWERISLDPDIELHIRRPLTRQQNKRVERLISIARQLLEEE